MTAIEAGTSSMDSLYEISNLDRGKNLLICDVHSKGMMILFPSVMIGRIDTDSIFLTYIKTIVYRAIIYYNYFYVFWFFSNYTI